MYFDQITLHDQVQNSKSKKMQFICIWILLYLICNKTSHKEVIKLLLSYKYRWDLRLVIFIRDVAETNYFRGICYALI